MSEANSPRPDTPRSAPRLDRSASDSDGTGATEGAEFDLFEPVVSDQPLDTTSVEPSDTVDRLPSEADGLDGLPSWAGRSTEEALQEAQVLQQGVDPADPELERTPESQVFSDTAVVTRPGRRRSTSVRMEYGHKYGAVPPVIEELTPGDRELRAEELSATTAAAEGNLLVAIEVNNKGLLSEETFVPAALLRDKALKIIHEGSLEFANTTEADEFVVDFIMELNKFAIDLDVEADGAFVINATIAGQEQLIAVSIGEGGVMRVDSIGTSNVLQEVDDEEWQGENLGFKLGAIDPDTMDASHSPNFPRILDPNKIEEGAAIAAVTRGTLLDADAYFYGEEIKRKTLEEVSTAFNHRAGYLVNSGAPAQRFASLLSGKSDMNQVIKLVAPRDLDISVAAGIIGGHNTNAEQHRAAAGADTADGADPDTDSTMPAGATGLLTAATRAAQAAVETGGDEERDSNDTGRVEALAQTDAIEIGNGAGEVYINGEITTTFFADGVVSIGLSGLTDPEHTLRASMGAHKLSRDGYYVLTANTLNLDEEDGVPHPEALERAASQTTAAVIGEELRGTGHITRTDLMDAVMAGDLEKRQLIADTINNSFDMAAVDDTTFIVDQTRDTLGVIGLSVGLAPNSNVNNVYVATGNPSEPTRPVAEKFLTSVESEQGFRAQIERGETLVFIDAIAPIDDEPPRQLVEGLTNEEVIHAIAANPELTTRQKTFCLGLLSQERGDEGNGDGYGVIVLENPAEGRWQASEEPHINIEMTKAIRGELVRRLDEARERAASVGEGGIAAFKNEATAVATALVGITTSYLRPQERNEDTLRAFKESIAQLTQLDESEF